LDPVIQVEDLVINDDPSGELNEENFVENEETNSKLVRPEAIAPAGESFASSNFCNLFSVGILVRKS
jgi:hypothetical protein